jgi:hypothetical protein
MALQLELNDKYGNVYPQGYRRYRWFSIDVDEKTVTAIFVDYPSEAFRRDHPKDWMNTITYIIGPTAQPAKFDEEGHEIAPAIPAFDDYMEADNKNQAGYGEAIYGFALTRPENAGAINV